MPSRIQFAPIVGSTVEAVTPLTQRLAERAHERGIGLAGKGGDATHILKGYFSAISEGGATTVIYVWDVLDPSGNRLHRIQGQAKADGRGEGWPAVPPATMKGDRRPHDRRLRAMAIDPCQLGSTFARRFWLSDFRSFEPQPILGPEP